MGAQKRQKKRLARIEQLEQALLKVGMMYGDAFLDQYIQEVLTAPGGYSTFAQAEMVRLALLYDAEDHVDRDVRVRRILWENQ